MVFDVESLGLHGEAYAVGVVAVDDGEVVSEAMWWCSPLILPATSEARAWMAEHADPTSWRRAADQVDNQRDLRERFWGAWARFKKEGYVLAADCPWPVEARFLARCVEDDPWSRNWEGPYPLIDVASVRLAAGFDPLDSTERLPSELPLHNPLADARQSARLLIETLAELGQR